MSFHSSDVATALEAVQTMRQARHDARLAAITCVENNVEVTVNWNDLEDLVEIAKLARTRR